MVLLSGRHYLLPCRWTECSLPFLYAHTYTHRFFVDLASNDAVDLSNTLTLEQEYDWEGLCVEPNLKYLPGLIHRRCQVAVAVTGRETNELVQINFEGVEGCGSGCGGIVDTEFDNRPDHAYERPLVEMKAISVAKLFADMNVPNVIDYLSLDIEGAEMWTFEHFPWGKYTFRVITVERPKELRPVLSANGYTYVKDHGGFGDELWIHNSLPNYHEVLEKFGA